ncbi:uncharacterized protein K02A2.6-like [Phlebotomus papatasi]|uniref:uncharacterized protein K02A2.6-like n=1 Tax=Phlebotomus papatasi TaxID=29031 RepID=UPI002483C5C6|nr:uncharacterized protein K02A2.6-like [Phlebotomus papatasi]
MLIDSGSTHNVIDEKTWLYMKKSGLEVINSTTECKEKLKAYGQNSYLQIVGQFEAVVMIEDNGKDYKTSAKFFVVKNGSQPLLGKITATILGVLIVELPSTRKSQINSTSAERVITPFPRIKGVKLVIPIDESVPPVSQHPRRPPIALQRKVEEKLNELLRLDIIEEAVGHSLWVSPVVVVPKGVDDIRLCIDMRLANKAIKREHYMIPSFDDFLPHLTAARVFSRIDIRNAYHQVELDEKCRYITTFITHKGVFRYKRLMFGISCAPEMFQTIMEQMLAKCSNTLNYIDDVVVFGKNEEEHDHVLRQVLDTLRKRDVLLNQEKCIFKVPEIVFLGHRISGKGIKPAEDKISSIKSFREPQTREELRSFLGLVNYVGRFIKDCATVTDPLRQLIHQGVDFLWEEKHRKAFETLKDMISTPETLSYFDNGRRTRVIADASPVGIGAVLVQFDGDNTTPQVIAYASKSLSKTEQRYCQTEREALALVWAVEKFSIYLIGREFELETDHKPLEIIFKPQSRPCARIERWVLRLQSFRFRVIYKKGSLNVADSLSRLATSKIQETFDVEDDNMVRSIVESAAVDVTEIEEASALDPEFGKLRESVMTGRWTEEVKAYQPFRDELTVTGNILIRGNKLVVPGKIRSRMLNLAHEGHPGESAKKRRLRDRVWWPGLDNDVTKFVKVCEGCSLVTTPNRPEPMVRRELPSGPWIDIALDFLGPLPSGEYLLVVVDYFSRYKEVEIMSKITAKETVNRLDKIFTRLGYPRTFTVDNGRQFVSEEFDYFCKERGITLNKTTPYWPQQNGEVKRQNRSLLKRLRISNGLNRDWKKDLLEYMAMYYTTPHSTTGRTPTELCLGRAIRGKIPSLQDIETQPPLTTEYRDRDKMLKEKGKDKEDKKRGAKESDIIIGDVVLMKNVLPGNKLTTTFGRNRFIVTGKAGASVTVMDIKSRKIYCRNSAHLKKVYEPEDAQSGKEADEGQQDMRDQEITQYKDDMLCEQDDDQETEDNIEATDRMITQTRNKRTVREPEKFKDFVRS